MVDRLGGGVRNEHLASLSCPAAGEPWQQTVQDRGNLRPELLYHEHRWLQQVGGVEAVLEALL